VNAGGDRRLVGDEGDDSMAGGGDAVGDCADVAAGGFRAADTGEGRDHDECDGGCDQSEWEPFHAPDTPLHALMSHVHYRFVDVRWALDDPGFGRRAYLEGHIPGAVFVDVEAELADPPGAGGRHPLPAAERFVEAMSRAGVGTSTYVVAYGTMGGAERLWWLLRHHGHDACAVLDLEGWHGPLTAGEEAAERRAFVSQLRTDDTIERNELAALGDSIVVVDARVPSRWRGEPNPVDRIPGRIPGALNAPWNEPVPELPAGGLVAYCGSGVTACVPLHQLHLAGREGRLYPGSWSEWEQHPELLVER
jgi:thiosulfate/3-mercaptopyruvate sulfurtransferase